MHYLFISHHLPESSNGYPGWHRIFAWISRRSIASHLDSDFKVWRDSGRELLLGVQDTSSRADRKLLALMGAGSSGQMVEGGSYLSNCLVKRSEGAKVCPDGFGPAEVWVEGLGLGVWGLVQELLTS